MTMNRQGVTPEVAAVPGSETIPPSDLPVGTPGWWDARYRAGDTPWDTGVVPPELVALVASGQMRPGWALDLGCGSGVSSRYLAGHGFRVVGVDLALSALRRAAVAARAEAVSACFCVGDVTDLGFLKLEATFALDIGCFHSVAPQRRQPYVASLAAHLLPRALYLLYAFSSQAEEPDRPPGIGPREIALFAPWFRLCWVQHGMDRDRPSAWYLLERVP